MSVERCPNCGRTWDGLLCFACGHERGKTPRAPQANAQTATATAATATGATATTGMPLAPPAPAPLSTTGARTGSFAPPPNMAPTFAPPQGVPPPTFARSPTPVAQFAPLPPLPPLGRAPTGAVVPGVGPQLPSGQTLPLGTPAPPPYQQAPYQQAPYSQAPYSQAPYSQAPYSQAPYSQAPYTPLAPSSGTLPPPPSFSPSPSFMTPGVLAGNTQPARTDTAPAPFPGFSRNSDHQGNAGNPGNPGNAGNPGSAGAPGNGGLPAFPAAPSSGFIPPSPSSIPKSTPSARSPYAGVGRDTAPLGFPAPQAPMPPLPPIQSRAMPPAQPRRTQTPPAAMTSSSPAPSSSAGAAARYDDEEQTAESALPPAARWIQLLRRLYLSPAVFGAVFLVGFTLTFLPGVIIAFQKPSVADMIEKRHYPEAIAELQRRRDAGEMKPGDWLLFGNALQLQYGPLQWDQMLQMYQVAATEKRVDATALENTVSALGDKERQKKAIEVLAAWPSSTDRRVDPTMKLAGRAGDDNFLVRHGAIEALKQRNAPADIVDDAVAACALADLRSRSCENNAAHAGLTDLERLIMKGAKAAIGHHDPNDALLAIAGAASAQAACVDPKAVDHVLKGLATLDGR